MSFKKIVIALCMINNVIYSFNYSSLQNKLQEKKRFKRFHSRVVFYEDIEGNRYVLKEYPSTARKPLLTVTVCELLATDMAHAVGVSHDRACLIPAGIDFVGKTPHLPASLHEFAPGIAYKACKNKYHDGFCLIQEKNRGLTRDIIYHMSCHKDLPAMVALDTFVGNNDRGRTNYFYDISCDTFTGIDLGCAFTRKLSAPSVENIKKLASDSSAFLSETEWQALSIYTATLQKLIDLYPPKVSCELLDAYIAQAGFYNDSYFDAKIQAKWQEYFNNNKRVIQENYESSLELLNVLQAFLRVHYV